MVGAAAPLAPALATPLTGAAGYSPRPTPTLRRTWSGRWSSSIGKAMSASSRSGALADRNFKLPVLGCKDNALTRFQVNRIEEVFPTDFAVNPPRFINRT